MDWLIEALLTDVEDDEIVETQPLPKYYVTQVYTTPIRKSITGSSNLRGFDLEEQAERFIQYISNDKFNKNQYFYIYKRTFGKQKPNYTRRWFKNGKEISVELNKNKVVEK